MNGIGLKLDNSIRTTYSYDAANQLQKYVDNTGTTTLGFDAGGNQRLQQTPSSGTTTNTWDYENRLTKVALASGVLNMFAYNGDGFRVQQQDSSGTSKQVSDGQKIVEETDENNAIQIVYTQSAGVYGDVVSQRRSGVASYFLFDPLGSAARLTDGNQNVTDTYLFKAFGEVLLAGSTRNPFRHLGKLGYYWEGDALLAYIRARYFSSLNGRWESCDPLGLSRTANLYLYVGNRPLVFVDPTGMAPTGRAVPVIPLSDKEATACDGFQAKLKITAPDPNDPTLLFAFQKVDVECQEFECISTCGDCKHDTTKAKGGGKTTFWEYLGKVQGGPEPAEVTDTQRKKSTGGRDPVCTNNSLRIFRVTGEIRYFLGRATPGTITKPIVDEVNDGRWRLTSVQLCGAWTTFIKGYVGKAPSLWVTNGDTGAEASASYDYAAHLDCCSDPPTAGINPVRPAEK